MLHLSRAFPSFPQRETITFHVCCLSSQFKRHCNCDTSTATSSLQSLTTKMLLRKEPDFAKRLGSLWRSVLRVQDLETLRKLMPNSTLVAFDIEDHVTSINEVGIAAVSISGANCALYPSSDGTVRTFCSENAVQAHTIMVREMLAKRGNDSIRYGDQVTVRDSEVSQTLVQKLSSLGKSEHLILVGYAMYTEFDWTSRHCPDFLANFSSRVDIQDIVEACCGSHPSLSRAMAALKLSHRNPTKSLPHGHRAANDAVGTLATLASLSPLANSNIGKRRRRRIRSCSQALLGIGTSTRSEPV